MIFDGSGRFGEEYQAVIFEDNVVVTNPEFTMTSDHLTAYFRKSKKPEGVIESISPESEGQVSRLEKAVATGDEVIVRKTIAGGEVQVAKSRKATFIARDPKVKGTFDEVILEIWPRVQRGNNLIIAKSQEDAQKAADTILAEAQEAAQRQRDRALADIETAKNVALGEVAEKSVDIALGLAGNIVRRQLTAEEHSELIRETLDKFPSKN